MSKRLKSYSLKLTAAIVLNGAIQKAGTVIDVDEALARNLVQRGRAEPIKFDGGDSGEQEVNIGKMKKPELVELATEYGIEDADGLTVDQLREAIKEANEADNE